MKKALIVTGGQLDTHWAEEYLKNISYDVVIAADGGLAGCEKLGIQADYCLGDFDSLEGGAEGAKKLFGGDVKIYPCEKDDTDTWLAIKAAGELKCTEAVIIGGTGTRLDHVFANIGNLFLAQDMGMAVELVDSHNKIYPGGKVNFFEKGSVYGKFISVLPYGGDATGVTYDGFKYNMAEGSLKSGSSLGVSNELLSEKGSITVEKGRIVIFETRD